MLSYKNFVQTLYEGLIMTHDLDKSVNIIYDLLSEYDIFYNVEKSDEYKGFKIFIEDPNQINVEKWIHLFKIINNLGYFQSAFRLSTKNMQKTFKWYDYNDFIKKINYNITKL